MAQHGSGDRKVAVGYRIVMLNTARNGSVTSYEVFASGWLQDPLQHVFFGMPCRILGARIESKQQLIAF